MAYIGAQYYVIWSQDMGAEDDATHASDKLLADNHADGCSKVRQTGIKEEVKKIKRNKIVRIYMAFHGNLNNFIADKGFILFVFYFFINCFAL